MTDHIPTRIPWDVTWMEMAQKIAERSKDTSTKIGAMLVSPDNTVAIPGYNGFPPKFPDLKKYWENRNDESGELTKYDLVLHAEANAMDNAQGIASLEGWTIYSTTHPCIRCMARILRKKIRRIVFLDMKNTKMNLKEELGVEAASHMGVSVERFHDIPAVKEYYAKMGDLRNPK